MATILLEVRNTSASELDGNDYNVIIKEQANISSKRYSTLATITTRLIHNKNYGFCEVYTSITGVNGGSLPCVNRYFKKLKEYENFTPKNEIALFSDPLLTGMKALNSSFFETLERLCEEYKYQALSNNPDFYKKLTENNFSQVTFYSELPSSFNIKENSLQFNHDFTNLLFN
jgi:hypothetical protein